MRIHIKIISDFCLFSMPDDHGRFSCVITNFIAQLTAIYYLDQLKKILAMEIMETKLSSIHLMMRVTLM